MITFEWKDQPVPLITDGKWHHLELGPGILSVAPEPGEYLVQGQLNGEQGEHDAAGNLVKVDKVPVGLLGTDIEIAVVRYPLSSANGITARTSIATARRQPQDSWAGTFHAIVVIRPPGTKDSERIGLDYKVKGGEGVSLDRILKFTRQWEIR